MGLRVDTYDLDKADCRYREAQLEHHVLPVRVDLEGSDAAIVLSALADTGLRIHDVVTEALVEWAQRH